MLESPLTHTTAFRGDHVTDHVLIYLTFPSWKLNNIAIAIVSSNQHWQHRQLNSGNPITSNLRVDLLPKRVLKWNIEKLAIKCIHRREKRSWARRPKRWTQRPWRGSKRHRPQWSHDNKFLMPIPLCGWGTSTPCLTTKMLMWPTTSLSLSLSLLNCLSVSLCFSLSLELEMF